ncbi:Rab-GTPase-TBC [Gracilaria domingensis]|nr:Rab-GTPase-TBC [Gracilaria domingensis]
MPQDDQHELNTSPAQQSPVQTESQLGREPITRYSSLSVNFRPPHAAEPSRGTLQIVEHDTGAEDDLWSIQINFIWRPRGAESDNEQPSNDVQPIKLSVDDFLTIRTQFTLPTPTLTIHLNGGRLVGDFYFPNGPDAAMTFFHSLRDYVEPLEMNDSFKTGDLYAVEKKNRMRRVAPSLRDADNVANDEDFADLLSDLSIGSTSRRRRGAPRSDRAQTSREDLGMVLLSQFALVTKVARDIGDGISTLLDEEKRMKEQQRKERESAARRRALDIYADIAASSSEERELPRRLELDEPSGVPVNTCTWKESLDAKGKLKDIEVMKRAIFAGGIEGDVRPVLWPFILGFYDWESSSEERAELLEKKRAEYAEMKSKWEGLSASARAEDGKSLHDDPNAIAIDRRQRVSTQHADYLEIEEQIEKDIIRTDRSVDLFLQDDSEATLVMGTILKLYATYDKKITYCQGMSDFLAPILYVVGTQEEAIVFWCFESLMRRIEANFRHDQSGMRRQLAMLRRLMDVADPELSEFFKQTDPEYYTCFRWILVRFKREFAFDAICRVWEALWCRSVGGDDLHIFVAAALLIAQRRDLLKLEEGAFDQLLRYVNDMSMRVDESFAIREGEICFLKYGEHSHVIS